MTGAHSAAAAAARSEAASASAAAAREESAAHSAWRLDATALGEEMTRGRW